MTNINNARSSFFPNAKPQAKGTKGTSNPAIQKNTYEKQKYLDSYTKRDAKVDIPEQIKDFAKIKRAVDMAPPKDNTDKIAMLKSQIANGTYKPDYDKVADKLLGEEFGIR